MWHYFWGHLAYHLMRLWNYRVRKCILTPLLIILSCITAGPQLYIIYIRDYYIMHCPYSFTDIMVVSVILTIIMTGFVTVFAILDHIGKKIKLLFHLFGVVDLIYELAYLNFMYKAYLCSISAAMVYNFCLGIAIVTSLSIVYFLLLAPFWIKEAYHHLKTPSLNRKDTLHKSNRTRSITNVFPCLKPI